MEYALIKKKKEIRDSAASSDPDVCSPADCDWMLYLCKVHWTKSMRVRRYIWSVCEEVKRVYDKKMKETDGCGFYKLSEEGMKPTEKRMALEAMAQQMFMMKQVTRPMKKGPKSAK
ncbi:hypothetical protein E1B28_004047 [Marasmius oreades]|uniref:Uncharacterized protein n=1 Tax=Marasmius oreades TaxID=181124 RepID=A0A9P8ACS0_9AGAR|nr:uncharacterized protein E1B28_004047 [Marasmius oreades]KAG7096630.1 hypothetical protein E1B28_004047 [Marasmius oreades]